MQNLKNSFLDLMMESRLSRAEVDVLLEMSHYQDDYGKVYGVFYRSICKSVNISYETFYTTLESLASKKLIHIEKNCKGDRDVTFINNDFSYPGARDEGYIRTGHYLFDNSKFKSLKAGEKLLAMQLFRITGAGKKFYQVGIDFFTRRYMELFGIKLRTLRLYLSHLKDLFHIKIKKRNYIIRPIMEECVYKELEAPTTDLKRLSEHLIRTACRRNKAHYTEKTYDGMMELLRQYSYSTEKQLESFRKNLAKIFLEAVRRSVAYECDWPDEPRSVPLVQGKWLNHKLIHKLMRH